MPFGIWMVIAEKRKGKIGDPTRVKILRTTFPHQNKQKSLLKYLDFAIVTEEGANELRFL